MTTRSCRRWPRLPAAAEIWNLVTDAGELDITVRPDGTNGYEDLRRHGHPLNDESSVVIASLEDVIRSKTAADRAKDRAALPGLRAALARQRTQDGDDELEL